MALYLCGLSPPKPITFKSNLKKTSDNFQYKGTLLTIGPILLKIVKVIKNKANWRNCHSSEET